jgi:hypothetical protein
MARTALKIGPGLFSDDTTHAAAGRWADGSNVRFRLGLPQTIGGWEGLTADLLGGVCRWVFPWGNNDNQLQFAFGTHATLEIWVGGGLYDITPTGLAAGEIDGTGQAGYGTGPYGEGGYATPSVDDYFPRTWSGGAYGQDLIASPRLGGLYRWDADDTGTPAAAIANAPASVTYALVSAQNFVFALGCNRTADSVYDAMCVRHHDVADITDWTVSTTNTAREYNLPGGGRIVGGRVIGDAILVWSNSALFLFRYLGQFGGVYRFDQVGAGCGLIGPGAAKVVGQTAYWISPDRQFWAYTLGGEPQPLPCPIREDFADNLAFAQADKIVASSVSEFGEVWWDYPDARDGYENSRYIAVPVNGPDAGAWFRGQMARTARVDAGPSPYPLATTFDGGMYWHERGESADGAALSWFVESADQYMSEQQAMMMRAFWPDAEYQIGAVALTLTTRYRPRGDETVRAYTISPTAEKVDTRASGRLFRIKLSGSSSPAAFRLGRAVMDTVPLGMR